MPVKSLIDIEINDSAFQRFSALWEKYQKALEKTPGTWAQATKQINEQAKGFEMIAAEALTVQQLTALRLRDEKDSSREVDRASRTWREMARNSRSVADNVRDTTLSLLKWTGLATVLGGIFGGIGFDKLAATVSSGRRSALGLGISYGAQAAFGVDFSRLVDPQSFLQGVAGAKFDVTQRVGLLGAGLTPGEINADTGTTATALLRNLFRIADTTNPALYEQVIGARRLGQFVNKYDLERFHETPQDERAALLARFSEDSTTFNLPPATQRAWQELTTAMSRAGQGIETTFVRGLAPLTPALTKFVGAFEHVVEAFVVKGGPLGHWIDTAGKGLEKFANYIGTPSFESQVETIANGIGILATWFANVVSWFGGGTAPSGADLHTRARRGQWLRDEAVAPAGGWSSLDYIISVLSGSQTPINNPGNLRPPGAETGFAHFASPEAGIAAIARQLRLYASGGNDTVAGIVSKYAPGNENNTAAYIADVSKRTGYAPGQHLNLNDPQVLASLIAAITRHEQKPGSYDRYKDAKVVVEVLNNTGGNATVTVNGLKN